jgi:hypothetical protein
MDVTTVALLYQHDTDLQARRSDDYSNDDYMAEELK